MTEREWVGKRVVIKDTTIEGEITDIQTHRALPSLVNKEVWELPDYIEIDGNIQVHPSRVIICDGEIPDNIFFT